MPPSAAWAHPSRNRSRTVRFSDVDGEVAMAATAYGCRRVPVVEVEDNDNDEESSDASSDLFELKNLATEERSLPCSPVVGEEGARAAGRLDKEEGC
jgi:hypothetical protein